MSSIVRLAITSGHLNGIGPEIILKSILYVFHDHSSLSSLSKQDSKVIRELKLTLTKEQSKKEILILGSLRAFIWHGQKSNISFSVMKENPPDLIKLFHQAKFYRIISIGIDIGSRGKQTPIPNHSSIVLIDIPLNIPPSFDDFSHFMRCGIQPQDNIGEKIKGVNHLNIRKSMALLGDHAYRVLEGSARLIKAGRIEGVINAPVSKESISRYSPKSDFLGQTEFYAHLYKTKKFSMAFISPLFSLVLLTTHIPISQVPSRITPSVVERGIEHAYEIGQYLRDDKKKILFLGINPHAGENGKIGHEDSRIAKIIRKHRYGKYVDGPVPADTAFIKVFSGDYRVVVAGYHDQGLIPLKSTNDNIRHSVGITWGLPFIRVTVDHGTAFDIVGKNIAQPFSFMTALNRARSLLEISKSRKPKSKLSNLN